MRNEEPKLLELGAVLLAAGSSTRMGRPKLLLPWRGTSVIGHLVAQWKAAGARQIAVVCGSNDEPMQLELDRLSFPAQARIFNPAPQRGMFSSIHCAASWTHWGTELTHWAIVLGDQPHLRAATLRQLIEFAQAHPRQICQPSRNGNARHPVLLPRREFLGLASSGFETLKNFLAGRPVALCELNDPGLELDLDRPEDYQHALKLRPD